MPYFLCARPTNQPKELEPPSMYVAGIVTRSTKNSTRHHALIRAPNHVTLCFFFFFFFFFPFFPFKGRVDPPPVFSLKHIKVCVAKREGPRKQTARPAPPTRRHRYRQ